MGITSSQGRKDGKITSKDSHKVLPIILANPFSSVVSVTGDFILLLTLATCEGGWPISRNQQCRIHSLHHPKLANLRQG
jgi:hypothetical protein